MDEPGFARNLSGVGYEYIEYIHTHSDHIMLREECKTAFYGGIRDAILRHGDRIEFRDEFVLYLCRKPSAPAKGVGSLRFLSLRTEPGLKEAAAAWFHARWGVPEAAYIECMDAYLSGKTDRRPQRSDLQASFGFLK